MNKILLVLFLFFIAFGVLAKEQVVRVQAEGSTPDNAKQKAFKLAIEKTVGQLIVGDITVHDDKIKHDIVNSHSSGYITDYEIVEATEINPELWHLDMFIRVSSSKIAQRFVAEARSKYNIDGQRLRDILINNLEFRHSGDTLIGQVLDSYPQHAYVINAGKTQINVDQRRRSYVDVPFNITMSRLWVASFDEALEAVSVDSSSCSSAELMVSENIKNGYAGKYIKSVATNHCSDQPDIRVMYKDGLWSTVNSYFLPDQITSEIINSQIKTPLGQQHFGLQVDLLDINGQVLDSRCANINNDVFIQYEKPRGSYNLRDMNTLSRPVINGQNNVYGTLRVDIKNINELEQLSKIKLSINQTCN